MSLIAHYPLIKDYKNYGLDDTDLTVMGTVNFTDGKLGTSATFTNSAANCLHRPMFDLYDNFSWCCWFKCSATTSKNQYILSQGRDTNGGMNICINSSGVLFLVLTNSSGSATSKTIMTIDYNVWYHISVTVNSKNGIQVYINGQLVQTFDYLKPDYTYASNKFVIGKMSYSYTSTSNYFPFNGLVQDVRIYDHVLSPTEVKELSKSLICHYPLNGNGFGSENLLTLADNNLNNWTKVGNASSTMTITNTDYYNEITYKTVGGWEIIQKTLTVEANTDYTLSFDYEILTAYSILSGYTGFCVEISTSSQTGSATTNSIARADLPNVITNKTRTYLTFNTTATTVYIVINGGYIADNQTANINFGNFKLEKGKTPTTWCPNKTDNLYSLLGLSDNIVYDNSGYLNNATLSSTPPTFDTDSPVYQGCYSFNTANKNYIVCGRGGMVKDEITVSIWAYMDSWSSFSSMRFLSCTETGGWNIQTNGNYFYCYMGTGASSCTYKCVKGKTQYTNLTGWHLFSLTYDGLLVKLYLDGVLDGTLTAYTTKTPIYYNASNGIFLGAEAAATTTTPTTTYFTGKLSDCRIYATALSADDIMDLYNKRFSIDTNGNFITYGSLVEE